jgi:hypothetical protein
MKLFPTAVAALAVAALVGAGGALAHQTATNNGVTVTMHVAPDDEPVATHDALVLVPKIKVRKGRFAWATCRCTLVISNSAREVLRRGAVTPRTLFTFPDPGAYRLTFSGRVKRKARWATFTVSFAIRASAPDENGSRKDLR